MEPLRSIRVSDPNRAIYYNKMNGLYYCRSAGRMWVYSGWVASAFEGDPLPEEFINLALTSPRVSRICRADDYDSQRKEVILWNP